MITKEEKENFQMDNEGKEIRDIDDLVLLHVTHYIPEGGIIKTPKGAGAELRTTRYFKETEFKVPSQRDTVHFTLNGDLSGKTYNTGTSSWVDIEYAIIIPFRLIDKDNFCGGVEGDVFFKGDVTIPKGAYILCPEGERENIQKSVGDDINVIGVEGEYIDGYTPILLQKLGYKNKTIGKYNNWEENGEENNLEGKKANEVDKKDLETAIKIIKEFNEFRDIHKDSKEYMEENMDNAAMEISIMAKIIMDKKADITIEDAKKIKNIIYAPSKSFLQSLKKNLLEVANITMPESVIDEIAGMPREDKSEQQWLRSEFKEMTSMRILGEVRLNQIQDMINQNPDMTFDELSKHFDDIAYDFTTEDRRNEFLNSVELGLSEVDKQVLSNKELKDLYSEINEIKDVPYEQLSDEQKEKVSQFKKFYENENKERFSGYRLMNQSKRDEDGHITMHMAIMRDDFEDLSPEEMQKIQSECIGVDEETAFLNFETKIQGQKTLSQYLSDYENYIKKLDELMGERDNKRTEDEQLKDEISVEDLGKQTLEEQKDTKAKIDMEQKLQQKMKEYAISQEEKGEEK